MKHWFPDGTSGADVRRLPAFRRLGPERGDMPTVALYSASQMAPWLDAWAALERRAAEPNPFYSADMALAAIRHLRDGQGLSFLAVRDAHGERENELLALLPLRQSRLTLDGKSTSNWQNPLFPLGAPLVDRERGVAALAAALGFLCLGKNGGATLILRQTTADGPVAGMLREAADRLSLPIAAINPATRAALVLGPESARAEEGGVNKKRMRELGRQRRRLAERGAVAFMLAADYKTFRQALEEFLGLEAMGWKGERGTALVQEPGSASFARAALWPMARAGKASIARLTLDDRTIAAGIILHAAGASYFWKIAYDESLSAFAPGVMLIDRVGAALGATPAGPGLIDSCALQGNRMIEDLWKGRVPICDVVVGLAENDVAGFDRAITREALRRTWRERAKALYYRFRGRN